MSRSVFANTIGAFVLDGIPSHTHARSNNLGFLDVDALVERGKEAGKEIIVETVEDTVDSALQSAGLTSGQQQQQSVPQDYNPMAAAQALAANRAPLASSGMLFRPGINAQTVATAQGVLDAQRRVQQAQAFDTARRAGELLNQQSQVTGEDSQVTRTDKEKDEKKKPFFKTGAGIATILVGAAAIAGGIVYFATQE